MVDIEGEIREINKRDLRTKKKIIKLFNFLIYISCLALILLVIFSCTKDESEDLNDCECETVLVFDQRPQLPNLVPFQLRACELNQDMLDRETYDFPFATTLSGEQAEILSEATGCN